MSLVMFLVLLWVSGGSSSDQKNITAHPGEDVTLACKDLQISKIALLLWSKSKNGDDHEKMNLFVIRDGQSYPAAQHESFKDRVFLKDDQMKDGDLSVVLENVTMEDSGIYQCGVIQESDPLGSPLNLISSIDLSVTSPGEEEEEDDEDGTSRGLLGLIVLPVLVVVLVLVLWIYRKKSRGSPADSSDKQMDQL